MEENVIVQEPEVTETVEAQAEWNQPQENAEIVKPAEGEPKKRRGGRKPMTSEQKEAARKAREARKMAAESNQQEQETQQAEEPEPKKRRGGRKPFTAEQKTAAAKARAEAKEKAANLTPEVYVQYQDIDASVQSLIVAAREDFRNVKKRMRITDMQLYVKPEERTAYYVINGDYSGKVTF